MERTAMSSSNLVSVGYEEDQSLLEIEFRNGVYQYFDVPSHVFEELIRADSAGSYFYSNIRGAYSYSQV